MMYIKHIMLFFQFIVCVRKKGRTTYQVSGKLDVHVVCHQALSQDVKSGYRQNVL